MSVLFWATVPAIPTPNGILISSLRANLTASSSSVSCLTSKSFATKYRWSDWPLAKKSEPRSACVSRLTFLRILWQRTSMSSSLATSLMSSMKSSDSSMCSRSRWGRTSCWCWLSPRIGEDASHNWKRSDVMEVLLSPGPRALCSRFRSSGDACSLSHCSTRSGFASSHVPADAKSVDGGVIAPHCPPLRGRRPGGDGLQWRGAPPLHSDWQEVAAAHVSLSVCVCVCVCTMVAGKTVDGASTYWSEVRARRNHPPRYVTWGISSFVADAAAVVAAFRPMPICIVINGKCWRSEGCSSSFPDQ